MTAPEWSSGQDLAGQLSFLFTDLRISLLPTKGKSLIQTYNRETELEQRRVLRHLNEAHTRLDWCTKIVTIPYKLPNYSLIDGAPGCLNRHRLSAKPTDQDGLEDWSSVRLPTSTQKLRGSWERETRRQRTRIDGDGFGARKQRGSG
jgi:hypothetical protein